MWHERFWGFYTEQALSEKINLNQGNTDFCLRSDQPLPRDSGITKWTLLIEQNKIGKHYKYVSHLPAELIALERVEITRRTKFMKRQIEQNQ